MTVEEFVLFEQAGLDPTELEELDDRAPATGALVRVVPAEPARHDGFCITAVVLYEHGFELTWHAVRDGDLHSLDSFDLGRFEAADDLGTEYRPVEPGSSQWSERDGPYAVIGASTCATAVPDEARELRIAKASSNWSIRLR